MQTTPQVEVRHGVDRARGLGCPGDGVGCGPGSVPRVHPPVPSVVFAVALVLSMGGLAYALRTIPVGTGYAIWVGIGAVGTAAYGMAALGEAATAARLVCLAAIVAGVVGLKFLH